MRVSLADCEGDSPQFRAQLESLVESAADLDRLVRGSCGGSANFFHMPASAATAIGGRRRKMMGEEEGEEEEDRKDDCVVRTALMVVLARRNESGGSDASRGRRRDRRPCCRSWPWLIGVARPMSELLDAHRRRVARCHCGAV